jgi:hypothetical protein
MAVVINELEVVPADAAAPPASAAAAAPASGIEPRPDIARQVEQVVRARLARAERLRAC